MRQVFGVVGSGNFHVTNALIDGGARFVAARHEGGAATMADAYSRMSGTVAALSVHQGCGLTNAMTGITEAAKSRTPMLVLAAEASQPLSNFYVDQVALVEAVGAVAGRVTSADDRRSPTRRRPTARRRHDRRTVVLNLPLDVQAQDVPRGRRASSRRRPEVPEVATGRRRQWPASPTRSPPRADRCSSPAEGRAAPGVAPRWRHSPRPAGALVATSAVAKGLFHGNPWSLGHRRRVLVTARGRADRRR